MLGGNALFSPHSMRINLIQVPYHLKAEGVGMGRGPLRFVEAGLVEKLRQRGHTVDIDTVRVQPKLEDDLDAIARINAELSSYVEASISNGRFPLVLGGNCNTCLGVLAGLAPARTGIIWFDAHGDFNTPETSPSGFLDGMALAMATGHCHERLWQEVGDGGPVPESHTLLVGVRDLDEEERRALELSKVLVVPAAALKRRGGRGSLVTALEQLRSQTDEIYLHLDIDVLDPEEAPGVEFRSRGGLFLNEMEPALETIGKYFRIRAANLAAYNPDLDENDTTLRSGFRLLAAVVDAVSARRDV
jgi:arginase